MVIHNFHVKGVSGVPHKAEPELSVDPDGMLTDTISGEGLKRVAGTAKIVQTLV